jgi:VanZ family protein
VAGLLATIVALILYVTLSPFDFSFGGAPGSALTHLLHSWPHRTGWAFARDAVLNVALFLPLGVAGCVTYAHHWNRRTAVVFAVTHGFVLSLGIELLQHYEAVRDSTISDLLFNTLGALFGAWLGLVYQRRIDAVASAADRRGAPAGLLLAACWMTAQLYPFLPIVRRARLSLAWAHLTSAPISWLDVATGTAGWFVFALALRAVWGKLPWAWLALSMLVVPLRMVILDRTAGTGDVVSALIALALWCLLSDSVKPGTGWVLMVAAVVLRELAPFDFSAAAHAFSWWPFSASMSAEHAGIPMLARKAFEYGALVWMLQAGKFRHLTAGVLVAIGLFGMEMMQTRMPGKHPEITDSVIALVMALILRLLG